LARGEGWTGWRENGLEEERGGDERESEDGGGLEEGGKVMGRWRWGKGGGGHVN
jgi:hypothetical protein